MPKYYTGNVKPFTFLIASISYSIEQEHNVFNSSGFSNLQHHWFFTLQGRKILKAFLLFVVPVIVCEIEDVGLISYHMCTLVWQYHNILISTSMVIKCDDLQFFSILWLKFLHRVNADKKRFTLL